MGRNARTRLTLRPGQDGTKKLQRKYGNRLVAVRYHYDGARRMRVKTVELIEEELPWMPAMPPGRDPHEIVRLRIGYEELALRRDVTEAGGIWEPRRRLWRVSLGTAYRLGLENRIVP